MVIDEIQRVPDLLLAIKEQVDADPRPGRYLLTGSARLLGLRGLPDTLPGRPETIELWPLAETGRQAVELLLRSIAGEPVPERTPLLPVELIVRGSCGAPTPAEPRALPRALRGRRERI